MQHTSLLLSLIVALVVICVPSSSFAEEWIQFDEVRFTIEGDQSLTAFEEALLDLQRLSDTYHPEGADISDRRLTSRGPRGVPRMVFEATHRVGIIRHSAVVRADIDTRQTENSCGDKSEAESSYRIEVDTDASEHLVAANVDTFTVKLCVDEADDGDDLDVVARGRMKKGYSYGRFAGPAIRDLIKAQVDPLLDALQQVVDYYQRQ